MRKLALLLLFTAAAAAQMLDPAIDRPGEPFSYFSRPTDVIGVMDAPEATEVTPEGYLYTGFGELMFFTGNPPQPVEQRVKTLRDGHLPVVEYHFTRDGLEYRFTMFAATLDGRPEGTLVDFIRVTVRNPGRQAATAWLTAAMRYQAPSNHAGGVGDNRFRRPITPKYPGAYSQPGVAFNPDWTYGFSGNAFVRDGRAMYLFPGAPAPELRLTLKSDPAQPEETPRKIAVQETEPVGAVLYRLPLAAGGEKTLEFRMPVVPPAADSDQMKAAAAADFDRYLATTSAAWEKILAQGMEVSVPEAKVVDTFQANLIYDLIARDKLGDDYIQTVNKFHYHAFWLRDSSYIVRMYDATGYPEFAAQDLAFFPRWQQPDGNFVSQGGQFDGWGQTLWAYGQHYRLTHDRAFAERVFPAVVKAVAWLQRARAGDPLHVMPVTRPGDNEDIEGHVTGHNFWALAGLKNAIALAEGLGRQTEEEDFRREYDDYRAALLKVLDGVTAATHGYMPPGLDGQHGQDWGNMLAVYPEEILDPHDAKVTATLQGTRAKYQEGIMTYGDGQFLHHYLTMKNTETEVIRGDREWALQEFYALLLHTSSTQAGFEYDIAPWGPRDFQQNLAPHGWFAAKFRTLLRDMLVREQGQELHLMSVVSPAWVKAGDVLRVRRAPTEFGEVNYELQCEAAGAVLRMENRFERAPAKLTLHLPLGMNVTGVSADGKAVQVSGDAITVPAGTREVRFRWTRKPGAAAYSYEKAVADYKTEYRRRYQQFLRTGERGMPGH